MVKKKKKKKEGHARHERWNDKKGRSGQNDLELSTKESGHLEPAVLKQLVWGSLTLRVLTSILGWWPQVQP